MFLNKVLIAILLFSAAPAFACEALDFDVEGTQQQVCFRKDLKAVLSVSCASKKCGAAKYLAKVRSGKTLAIPPERVQNPGSVYCKALGGKPVMGRNPKGSQIVFCEARDKSLVDLTALYPRVLGAHPVEATALAF